MFANLLIWAKGLGVVGKVAVATVTLSGVAVVNGAATTCKDAPLTRQVKNTETVNASITYIKDGSLADETEQVVSNPINGDKETTLAVTTKCDIETSRTFVDEKLIKEPQNGSTKIGTRRIVTEEELIPYSNRTINDSTLEKGQTRIITNGADGTKSVIYAIFQNEGQAVVREKSSEEVITAPINEVVAVGTKTYSPPPTPSNCHPSYSPCVPDLGYDLDCPDIGRRVKVIGYDEYRLDADDDGTGCDSY